MKRRWSRNCARRFGDCTKTERQDLIDRLKKQRNFAYVRRQVTPEEAQRVEALNLDGIASQKESRRYYPNKELAAHLLGFVGLDNKGLVASSLRTTRRFAARKARFSFIPTRGGTRSVASSGRRPPARPSS